MGIAPINTDDNVNSLLQRLNWKAEDYVQVKAVGGHTGRASCSMRPAHSCVWGMVWAGGARGMG